MKEGYIILYQNHGNSIGYWESWVEGSGTVVVQYAKKLDGKAVRKEYQAVAKNVGKSNFTSPHDQALLEVASKARLKIDKGYVETLEEAEKPSTNSLGFKKPMLATPLEKVKPEKIDWSNAFVQPKLDGHRGLYDNSLYSRQGKTLNVPHIEEELQAMDLDGIHLDGEIYCHGYTLQELSALIKKNREESIKLEYHVYDIVSDKTFEERIKVVHAMFYGKVNSSIKAVETIRVNSMEEALEHHEKFRAEGYEGTMLRFGESPYKDGKRSTELLKIKEFQDAEFCVVGIREGKPYITDRGTFRVPIWVCCTPDDVTNMFTVTAAGTMEEKHEQWENREDYLYKFLTVKFHYYSADGVPQIPIALRFYCEV